MQKCWMLRLLVTLMAVAPCRVASAQDQGRVGLTMGYPASVGVIYHVANRFALRPEITVLKSSGDSGGTTIALFNKGWSLGTGLSGLIYLTRRDNLRTYVSPRFTFTRITTSTETTAFVSSTVVTRSTSSTYGAVGSLGAQYALGPKFGLFGEVGFGYSRQTSHSSLAATSRTNVWSSRTGAGVILYF